MVSDDVILEQVEHTYDPAGNVILTATRQRYHNAPASQTGPLADPSTTPKARVTYVAFYHDPIGRLIATADYGTNGGVPLTRSPTIPPRSDTVLVTRQKYDRAGNVSEVTDPSGMVTKHEHDAAGRKTKVIENYQAASSSSSSSSSSGGGCQPSDDANRTTRFTYTPDGQQATLTAENSRTGDQTTTWTYGTTLADSEIASSQLLRSVAYPDSTGSGDTVRYTHNRQSERITLTDQRGCVHTYDRDKLGRILHDRVTTLGSGVDGAIRRFSTTYDVRGLTSKLTSWNNASVNSGDVVNECQFVYNSFMQLIADYQSHSGAVNTGTTPKVQYGYADGSTNTIRPVTITYPNGRVITYDYGTADGINDTASRIASLIDDDDTHLVDYSFLGLGIIVVADYTEPDVKYTLVDLSGTNDPDTGDIYSGLDRFGRVKDCRWRDYGNNTDTVRLKYGYDRASNRLWRADLVAQSLSKDFDELYSYDGLHRLKDMQRGLLNGSNTAVSDQNFGQCWSLDPTSNWHGFKEAATGGSWTLDQSRSANTVNEITDITNWTGPTWVTPAYDATGNTMTIPQPADPTESFTGIYDAWNRLVKLVDDATDDTAQESQYDARTFRMVRKDYVAGVLAETRHFYYTSGWQSVEERLGSSPNSADAERQFVWGQRYIDDLVLRDRDTDDNSSLDERLYAMQDANWNMVALIDTSAAAQERYLYSPFGWPIVLDGSMSTIQTDSGFGVECLFTGQRFDWTTELHLFRNRSFDSASGRFINRDPLMYPNGASAYGAWFVPSQTDWSGLIGSFNGCPGCNWFNQPPQPPIGGDSNWGVSSFLWHYRFGNGTTVFLKDTGLFNIWLNNRGVRTSIDAAKAPFINLGPLPECNGTITDSGTVSVNVALETPARMVYDAFFDALKVLNQSTVTMQYSCTYKSEECKCCSDGVKRVSKVGVSCKFSFRLIDRFENPADIGGPYNTLSKRDNCERDCRRRYPPTSQITRGFGFDNLGICLYLCRKKYPHTEIFGGLPFDIVANWTESVTQSVSRNGCVDARKQINE